MWIEALIASVFLLLNIFFMKEKPLHPPSVSATLARTETKKSLKIILKNKDFILVLLEYGLFFGSFKAISITASFILAPFSFDSFDTSIIIGATIISGFISSVCLG